MSEENNKIELSDDQLKDVNGGRTVVGYEKKGKRYTGGVKCPECHKVVTIVFSMKDMPYGYCPHANLHSTMMPWPITQLPARYHEIK